MNQAITVIYDGQALHPEQPLNLTPHQKYRIMIETENLISENKDGWDIIESLIGSVDAPEDWSIEHDYYLYGSPKKYSHDEQI